MTSLVDDCLFCKIIRGEIPSQKVFENEHVLAFRDINPQAPTHVLVIPKEHRETLSEYIAADAELLGQVLAAGNEVAKLEGLEDFRAVFNCGEGAGQAVFHLHLHILGGRAMSWPPG